MIFYLKKKFPHGDLSYEVSEDVLTGTVFGHLRYFSSQKLLVDFLNEAVDLSGKKLLLSTGGYFEIEFWERYTSGRDEPDLILRNNQYDIIVECKYKSGLGEQGSESEKDYTNQLIRYSELIKDSLNEKILIFLTNDDSMPKVNLKKTENKLDKNIKLYWLSWGRLYYCMKKEEENEKKYLKHEKLLFADLLGYLEKRNFIAFCGIRKSSAVDFIWHYRRKYFGNYNTHFSWRYRK
jgi:hypothetical protein